MSQVDRADVVAALDEEAVEFLGPADVDRMPAQWREIVAATTPEQRCHLALARWNPDLLTLLPRFAAALREQLREVLVCRLRGECVLIYVFDSPDDDPYAVWIGWAPGVRPAQRPALWESVPAPLHTFLDTVHAGFTAEDGESYGPVRASQMLTLAQEFGTPAGIPGWNQPIESTRLLFLTKTYSNIRYYLSPDLPPNRVVLTYESDFDIEELWTQLDQMMVHRIG